MPTSRRDRARKARRQHHSRRRPAHITPPLTGPWDVCEILALAEDEGDEWFNGALLLDRQRRVVDFLFAENPADSPVTEIDILAAALGPVSRACRRAPFQEIVLLSSMPDREAPPAEDLISLFEALRSVCAKHGGSLLDWVVSAAGGMRSCAELLAWTDSNGDQRAWPPAIG